MGFTPITHSSPSYGWGPIIMQPAPCGSQTQLLLQSQSWPPELFQAPGTGNTSKISDKSRTWSISRLKTMVGSRGFTSFFSRVVKLRDSRGSAADSPRGAGGSSDVVRSGSMAGSMTGGTRRRAGRSLSKNLESQQRSRNVDSDDPMRHRSTQWSKIEPGGLSGNLEFDRISQMNENLIIPCTALPACLPFCIGR